MRDGALAGRTVVVTRAAEQADGLAGELRALGADVVVVPLLSIEAPHDGGAALRAAVTEAWDWVVVPSANAARALLAAGGRPPGARVGVVGPATAAALADGGVGVDARAEPATAGALVAALPAGPGRVLAVQGDRARPELVDGLRGRGWTVEAVVAYRTVPCAPDAAGTAALAGADAVTVASPSAVEACVAAGARPGGVVVAIGPTTAAAVRAAGWAAPVVAEPHTAAGLRDAVVRALAPATGGR